MTLLDEEVTTNKRRRRRGLACLKVHHCYNCHYFKMAKLSSLLLTTIFLILLDNHNNLVTLSHPLEANNINYHQQASARPNFSSNNHNPLLQATDKEDSLIGSPPVVKNHQQDRIVGVGSNISLECTAKGKGLTFVWFQDERNITTPNNNSTNQAPEPNQPTTKLLQEKRYEISEEQNPPESGLNVTTSVLYLFNLKLTDTSLFLCWVENNAGYTIANFSLTVTSDLPPSQFNGQLVGSINNEDQSNSTYLLLIMNNRTRNYISLVFVLVLIIGIALLLLFKLILSYKRSNLEQRSNSSQTSSSNDLKQQNLHHHQGSSISSNDDNDQISPTGTNNEYGFIEHMRSGIINMDYHSMSPVIQFNQNSKQQLQQQHHHHQQQHLHQQQLSSASLLRNQHPPMYSDVAPIPDFYHAAATATMYNRSPSNLLSGPQPVINHHLAAAGQVHQSQQQSQQFIQDMMGQAGQLQPPRNNYQGNLDYDRFHIL